jgi:hypothetical protein
MVVIGQVDFGILVSRREEQRTGGEDQRSHEETGNTMLRTHKTAPTCQSITVAIGIEFQLTAK